MPVSSSVSFQSQTSTQVPPRVCCCCRRFHFNETLVPLRCIVCLVYCVGLLCVCVTGSSTFDLFQRVVHFQYPGNHNGSQFFRVARGHESFASFFLASGCKGIDRTCRHGDYHARIIAPFITRFLLPFLDAKRK